MPVDAKSLGEFLRDARERQGKYSQEQAAHEVETTGRTMGTWERGVAPPPGDKLLALVKLYGAERRLLVLLGNWEGGGGLKGRAANGADRRTKAGGE